MKRSEIKALFPEATKDQIDSVMDLHGEGLETIKNNYKDYVPKSDLDTITAELATLKAAPQKQEATAEQLAELESLRKFKTDTETKVTLDSKASAITKALEAAKANPKAIKLLLKDFDLGKVELTDSGEIKDAETLLAPIKTNYADFFGVDEIAGAVPGKAPVSPSKPGDPFLEGFNSDDYTKK